MFVFDLFPLVYFSIAIILAPSDYNGCKDLSIQAVKNLVMWVYGPLFIIRILGLVALNTRKLVVL